MQQQQYSLEDIQDQIIDAIKIDDFPRARQLIEILYKRADVTQNAQNATNSEKELNKLRREYTDFQARLKEPPLVQGVVIRVIAEPPSAIVGIGSERWEVGVVSKLPIESLAPGDEVWLKREERVIVRVTGKYPFGMIGEVAGELDGGRVRVRLHAENEFVVEKLSDLKEVTLDSGDQVRFDPQLAVAYERIPKQEHNKDLELETLSEVEYEDIGGLGAVLAQVRESIEQPYLFPHLYTQYSVSRPKGILLYGPPGCGKTMIAKAIANNLTRGIRRNLLEIREVLEMYLLFGTTPMLVDEIAARYARWQRYLEAQEVELLSEPLETQETQPNFEKLEAELYDFLELRKRTPSLAREELDKVMLDLDREPRAHFLSIKGPELLSKWVGESEHSIRQLFAQAREIATFSTPVIIFFDEIDALFQRRGSRTSSADMESTIVPQFLSEMDGIEELEHVLIIGATNRMDRLDEAILRPGRLDRKIEIERPKEPKDGAEIFRKHLYPAKADARPPFNQVENDTGSEETYVQLLIDKAIALIYSDSTTLRLSGTLVQKNGQAVPTPISCNHFVSGAMFKTIVDRAKRNALNRHTASSAEERGIRWNDLRQAIADEMEENKDQFIYSTYDVPDVNRQGIAIEVVLADENRWTTVNSWLTPAQRPWMSRNGG